MMGLPEAFGVVLLTLTLVVALSPYLGGMTIGNLAFPTWPSRTAFVIRIVGPVFFTLMVIAFLPGGCPFGC